MKNKMLLALGFCLPVGAFAQLSDGSTAPDFTVTDLNGNSHNLYAYLDSGYTVYLDLMAAWCPPCWTYHTSGALHDLYMNYGPGTADNKVRVLMIESEATNATAQLYGTDGGGFFGSTQGDWVTGTPYPIADDASIGDLYQISFYPNIFRVCPDHRVYDAGTETAAVQWAAAQSCYATAVEELQGGASIARANMIEQGVLGVFAASGSLVDVRVHDNMGRQIAMSAARSSSTTIQTEGWAPGLYLVNVRTTKGAAQLKVLLDR